MTRQIHDRIIVDGSTCPLYSRSPLNIFSSNKELSIGQIMSLCEPRRTDNQRGFVAEWEIDNNFLFLIKIKPASLFVKLFPDQSGRIEASWFSGDICIPQGDRHTDSGLYFDYEDFSEYDHYRVLRLEAGKVIRIDIVDASYMRGQDEVESALSNKK